MAVDTTAGTLQVSTAASGLQISTAGVISGVGTDADVNIQLTPKGQGDVIVNGAQNRKFRINDGVDVFSIDMDLGEVDLIGHLDTNDRLRIKDSEISNISGATLSFGQVVTVDTSGTATSFTDGSYTAVAVETTSGIGTGATFDVTVASGTITAITVTASSAGRDYRIGDTIVLATATIGTDAAQTITITDVRGTGIDLTPRLEETFVSVVQVPSLFLLVQLTRDLSLKISMLVVSDTTQLPLSLRVTTALTLYPWVVFVTLTRIHSSLLR